MLSSYRPRRKARRHIRGALAHKGETRGCGAPLRHSKGGKTWSGTTATLRRPRRSDRGDAQTGRPTTGLLRFLVQTALRVLRARRRATLSLSAAGTVAATLSLPAAVTPVAAATNAEKQAPKSAVASVMSVPHWSPLKYVASIRPNETAKPGGSGGRRALARRFRTGARHVHHSQPGSEPCSSALLQTARQTVSAGPFSQVAGAGFEPATSGL